MHVEVRAKNDRVGFGEALPYDDFTGETLQSTLAFVETYRDQWQREIADVDTLRAWAQVHREEIDWNPCAWTAVELAMLDVLGKDNQRSIEQLLELQPVPHPQPVTAVINDGAPHYFDAQLTHYICAGFRDFKIHLCGERVPERSRIDALLAGRFPPGIVRASAHRLWTDSGQAVEHLRWLEYPFWALEEPLAPGAFGELARLGEALNTRIILDHSCVRAEQLDSLGADAARWIASVRVAKMGGLFRALEVIARLRTLGIPIILGAQPRESRLLNRAALALVAPAGNLLLGLEGMFATLSPRDGGGESAIHLRPGGLVDGAALRHRAGHGLEIAQDDTLESDGV